MTAVVPVKETAIQDGYQPVLIAAPTAAGVTQGPPPTRARDALIDGAVSQFHVVEGSFGMWLSLYPATAVRGCYWPILIAVIIVAIEA